MMKKIVYSRTDGGVSIVHPFEGARMALSVKLIDGTELTGGPKPVELFLRRWPVDGAVVEWAETEDEFVERLSERERTKGRDPIIVDAESIPMDRTFRDAWVKNGTLITHDMDKCRTIHCDRLRSLRTPELAALDIAYMRADERMETDEKTRIAAMKQSLRDITSDPRIAAAQTPEALMALSLNALATKG